MTTMEQKASSRIRTWLEHFPMFSRLIVGLRKHRKLILVLFVIVAHLAGALTSVRAIMEVRTAQGTIAWVFALNTVPYVSVPAYWVFGRSKFQGYVLARRDDLTETHPIAIRYLSNLTHRGLLASP